MRGRFAALTGSCCSFLLFSAPFFLVPDDWIELSKKIRYAFFSFGYLVPP